MTWRVMVTQDETTFLRDQLKVFMVRKDEDGYRMVMPLEFVLGGPISDLETTDEVKPSVIPRELAELLFEQLGYVLLGVADPIREIRRLRRDAEEKAKMLNSLIDSIGRLGGKT